MRFAVFLKIFFDLFFDNLCRLFFIAYLLAPSGFSRPGYACFLLTFAIISATESALPFQYKYLFHWALT